MDVNEGSSGSPFEYDQVNIICPLYDQRLNPNEVDTEKFIIYHVNKEEFDTCRIMSAHPRIIAKCDKPYSLRYFTISFRSFSPTPGALEFHAGKDYYFISTSSQSDLHRRVDGMCRSHNMKMVFKVADKTKQPVVTQPPPEVTANSIVGERKLPQEQQEQTTKKHRKHHFNPHLDETETGQASNALLPGKIGPTINNDVDDSPVVVEEDRIDKEGQIRTEPKSLDYYLYQTRTNSIPSDDNKRASLVKSNGAVKQEASTGAASSSTTTTTVSTLFGLTAFTLFTVHYCCWLQD